MMKLRFKLDEEHLQEFNEIYDCFKSTKLWCEHKITNVKVVEEESPAFVEITLM